MNKMTREEKTELVLTTIVCLIPVIAGIILYPKLPDQIATHWDIHGNVNGMSNKFVGAIVFPGILVVANLIFPILLRLDPKYENMSGKLKTLSHWIIPVVEIFCAGSTLAAGIGMETHVEVTTPMLMGAMLVLIGNYLPKTKQSYTMGIKIPWTLNSEENWNHTHRMAGFLWVVGGLLMIISGLLPWKAVLITAIVIVIVIVPCVYSYLYYCKESRKNN